MDGQDYVNKFNPNSDFLDKPEQENYPSENEIISSQNDYNNNNSDNTNNTPNQNNNYCPPPIPSEVYQPYQPDNNNNNNNNNIQPNPPPQAPYLKYGAAYNPNYLTPAVPPPIPVGNDISYQPPSNPNPNPNPVLIPVQQQIVSHSIVKKEEPLFLPISAKRNNCCDCDCDCSCDCDDFCDCLRDCGCCCCDDKDCQDFCSCLLCLFCCCLYIFFGGN